jgi:arylsulfatase A-like enzyme
MIFSLAAVLALAKVLWVAGRHLPVSVWLPSVLLWQDIVIGLMFAAVVWRFGWRPAVWVTYAALVIWIAINIPVARTLSSPLTVPMLRATGGPLADSIALYVTPLNVVMIALVLAVGAVLPLATLSRRTTLTIAGVLIAMAVPGPFATSVVDVRGSERNAFTSVLLTAVPRISARPSDGSTDWRRPPVLTPAPKGPGLRDGAARQDDLQWLAGTARGRNLVLIFLESTAAQYLRSYGAGDDPMPTMTTLASEGIQFDSAYATYPESIKGLFGVLCSRHPGLDVSVEEHAHAACAPLPRALGDAGYQTALFHSGRFAYLGMRPIVERLRFDTLADAATISGQTESSFGVDEPSTIERALAWVDARDRRRPFFLAYLPIAGHHPYEAPTRGPFAGQGELSAYKNALRYADASVASLLDGLRTRGLERETLFVIFGDHGEAFGQHEGNYGHTFFTYEENVHVPMLVSIPGITTRPMRVQRPASVVDLSPTILALTGVTIPSSYEGTSLLDGDDRLAFFFTDYALAWAGLRDGCWKYVLEIEAKRSQLFDVCADRAESRNLASSHSDRVDAYRRRTMDWIAATRQKYVE